MTDSAARTPGSALARARAAVGLVGSAVLLPVGGHVLAGGSLPSLRSLLLMTALVSGLLLTAPARRSGPQAVLGLASATSAAQVVVHWAATAAHEHPVPGVGAPMLLAHLAAAGLTVLVLLRTEAALTALGGLLGRALDVLAPRLTLPTAPDVDDAWTVVGSDCVLVGRRLVIAAPRRGPPLRAGSAPVRV